MRDYAAERRAKKRVVTRTYDTDDSNTTCTTHGVEEPYNELLSALAEFSSRYKVESDARRNLLRLAWFLGERGEEDACRVIVDHCKLHNPYLGGPF